MRTSIIIALITLLPISGLFAQEDYSNKVDLKIGAGLGFMGWGDVTTLSFENEFNYKANNYFTAAAGFGIGRSIGNGDDVFERHSDYLQGSVNIFVSPFKNNKRNNFRIGGGYTYIHQATAYIGGIQYEPFYEVRYGKDQYSAHCFTAIVENEYKITTRLMIGVKLFCIGNFKDGDAEMSGGLIKFGVVL